MGIFNKPVKFSRKRNSDDDEEFSKKIHSLRLPEKIQNQPRMFSDQEDNQDIIEEEDIETDKEFVYYEEKVIDRHESNYFFVPKYHKLEEEEEEDYIDRWSDSGEALVEGDD